ncbi:hypothetical protein BpHYR1_014465 [Brachionus plicatilis]|uniref:Uncharacterized protein n=1 Tax=Brachionus plicatilis TaxID=10195 RepID=A0A3M7PYP8_BRAPC|nr:hypothetical protein BpHYR1_014465 [Brachionus plicatilis]
MKYETTERVMSKTYIHQDCEKTTPGVNHQNFYLSEIYFVLVDLLTADYNRQFDNMLFHH